MELTHQFTVPIGVEQTWEHFGDIAGLAECFPGAVVTGVEGDTFRGTVKVKLGPIALQYAGSGTFAEKDDAAHTFTVEAKGKDKRGNGTAGATVRLAMSEADGATTVDVATDLAVTGKPAQFGRGVMQDVSDKLLGQFVTCLEQRLSAPEPEPEAEPETQPESAAEPAAGAEREAAAVAAVSAPAPAAAPRPASSRPPADGGDDALDLGATVLPVLVKSYGPQIAAGLGVLGLLLLLKRLLAR
ncbi:SRPBCC family protein [Nocardioides acrostichi]|uniref:SRPBCC family protein n=1 Tax=Nocardioides acrostichi TaxID=2784339 RepID=A0A930Y725_9ACTN|nr:SRPBCC family protein [Nocardioides acrostichi]MBF4161556.1 SRPBCC family protein [Nocardioides acrostichi]